MEMKRSLVLEVLNVNVPNMCDDTRRIIFNEGIKAGDKIVVTSGYIEADLDDAPCWAWKTLITEKSVHEIKDFENSWAFVTSYQIMGSDSQRRTEQIPAFKVV